MWIVQAATGASASLRCHLTIDLVSPQYWPLQLLRSPLTVHDDAPGFSQADFHRAGKLAWDTPAFKSVSNESESPRSLSNSFWLHSIQLEDMPSVHTDFAKDPFSAPPVLPPGCIELCWWFVGQCS